MKLSIKSRNNTELVKQNYLATSERAQIENINCLLILFVEYSVWSPAGFAVYFMPSHNSMIGELADVHICSLLYLINVLY